MNARDAAPVILLTTAGRTSPVHGHPERRVRVAITSDPGELAVVERLLETLLALSALAPARVDEIVLAVSEAVCNVMRHGYGARPDRPVDIEFRIGSDLVRVVVEDRAPPLPDELARDLCARVAGLPLPGGTDAESIAESGWGLGLIARASQAIRHERLEDGNRLELDFAVAADVRADEPPA